MEARMNSLGERAVKALGFRWMPGMRMLHPRMGPARVLRVTQQGVWVAKEESLASGFRVDEDGCYPDLTDPATLGCLLALVREAWMCPKVSVRYEMGRIWRCVHQDGAWLGEGKSEAEALVAALEAAP